MTFISKLFGRKDSFVSPTASIVILVNGTLWDAEAGVLQLKMCGIGHGVVAGIAPLFGMERGLQAQISEGKWLDFRRLVGRWLLVIPQDAYVAFRGHLSGTTLVDGRVEPSPGEIYHVRHISESAVKQVQDLLTKGPSKE